MSNAEQVSEIELLKRRLQAFEEASPDLADKIRQREEQLRAQAEEDKIRREQERILSNIPDVIENLSQVTIGNLRWKKVEPPIDVSIDGKGYTDDERRFKYSFNKQIAYVTRTESIKMKEVLQMAFETIKDNKREINELKERLWKMEEYIAMDSKEHREQPTASGETFLDLVNSETIPLAKPIDAGIGIQGYESQTFGEDSDEARMNAAIAAHKRNQLKPKPKRRGNRSFMNSKKLLKWKI